MATYASVCPHCRTRIALSIVGHRTIPTRAEALYLDCSNCGMPSIAIVNPLVARVDHVIISAGTKAINQYVAGPIATYPEGDVSTAPDHIPAEVARVFIQARDAHVRVSLDLAAMGYRRALELALKAAAPELKGQLGPRIDQLAARNILTPAMKEWADDTRVLGNEATHDAPEPTAENVEQLFLFVQSLLEYLFTLPERVRLRRSGEAN